MFIAACQLRFRLPENHSLKGKRQVVKSVVERLRARYGLSAAEVESNDLWQIADIGFALVSGSATVAEETIQHAIAYIVETRPDIEVIDSHVEVMPFP